MEHNQTYELFDVALTQKENAMNKLTKEAVHNWMMNRARDRRPVPTREELQRQLQKEIYECEKNERIEVVELHEIDDSYKF